MNPLRHLSFQSRPPFSHRWRPPGRDEGIALDLRIWLQNDDMVYFEDLLGLGGLEIKNKGQKQKATGRVGDHLAAGDRGLKNGTLIIQTSNLLETFNNQVILFDFEELDFVL
ncbi:uncharacterized protein LOC103698156 [Phoenix dactylifera]|uniref:Uncharacterized protein LOC103698156 n=1 Tax=Phoenix dactylifera TaxID=42345 RepID=A0A8B8J0C7_PHODC|nr:uncharacterized protein LOC103698156 [Phoenix dactylifera]